MHELSRVGLGPRPFSRWAPDEHNRALPKHALAWLTRRLGKLTPRVSVAADTVTVPPSALSDVTRVELARIVGDYHVDDAAPRRRAHAGGQSYDDLVRRRSGVDVAMPDAVISPASHDEVAAVLAQCHTDRVAVVPVGGGTSVVGGVEPTRGRHRAVISIDLSRMTSLLEVNATDGVATFEAGVTGPRAEELLDPHGLTLGHVPQSFERATLGGYVATRSAGQASSGYGRINDLVVALRVATPTGSVELGTGTPNAAGPDLRALFVGSEGLLGVITEITLRLRPAPTERRYEMWAMPGFQHGVHCLRTLAQTGAAADVVRLSDENETEVLRALRGRGDVPLRAWLRLRGIRTPAFVVLGWEGTPAAVRTRRADARRILRDHRAIPLGSRAGQSWRAHRFNGPYQRDVLLDAGVLVETLETATTWSRLDALYAGLRAALERELTELHTPPVIMTHISHLYSTGASLYVTVLARQLDIPADARRQWARAKAAANDRIVELGGTITHHHAVGRDHATYLRPEIGQLGLRALTAVKAELDPHDVMNPGVLLGPSDDGSPIDPTAGDGNADG